MRWPEPTERFETRPPADRQVVTSSREFVRGYPYAGYAKSVYEVSAFDAWSTEFVLADLFEKSGPGASMGADRRDRARCGSRIWLVRCSGSTNPTSS